MIIHLTHQPKDTIEAACWSQYLVNCTTGSEEESSRRCEPSRKNVGQAVGELRSAGEEQLIAARSLSLGRRRSRHRGRGDDGDRRHNGSRRRASGRNAGCCHRRRTSAGGSASDAAGRAARAAAGAPEPRCRRASAVGPAGGAHLPFLEPHNWAICVQRQAVVAIAADHPGIYRPLAVIVERRTAYKTEFRGLCTTKCSWKHPHKWPCLHTCNSCPP
jgi:hypothetical protein